LACRVVLLSGGQAHEYACDKGNGDCPRWNGDPSNDVVPHAHFVPAELHTSKNADLADGNTEDNGHKPRQQEWPHPQAAHSADSNGNKQQEDNGRTHR